jgi:hypothetical protein
VQFRQVWGGKKISWGFGFNAGALLMNSGLRRLLVVLAGSLFLVGTFGEIKTPSSAPAAFGAIEDPATEQAISFAQQSMPANPEPATTPPGNTPAATEATAAASEAMPALTEPMQAPQQVAPPESPSGPASPPAPADQRDELQRARDALSKCLQNWDTSPLAQDFEKPEPGSLQKDPVIPGRLLLSAKSKRLQQVANPLEDANRWLGFLAKSDFPQVTGFELQAQEGLVVDKNGRFELRIEYRGVEDLEKCLEPGWRDQLDLGSLEVSIAQGTARVKARASQPLTEEEKKELEKKVQQLVQGDCARALLGTVVVVVELEAKAKELTPSAQQREAEVITKEKEEPQSPTLQQKPPAPAVEPVTFVCEVSACPRLIRRIVWRALAWLGLGRRNCCGYETVLVACMPAPCLGEIPVPCQARDITGAMGSDVSKATKFPADPMLKLAQSVGLRPERVLALIQVQQAEVFLAQRQSEPTSEVQPTSYCCGAKTPEELLPAGPKAVVAGAVARSLMGNEAVGRIMSLFWAGKYEEALNKAEQHLQTLERDPRLWYFKGFAELALGHREQAERSLARALWLHNTCSAEDQMVVAMALSRVQGKFRLALEELRLQGASLSVPHRSVKGAVPAPVPAIRPSKLAQLPK